MRQSLSLWKLASQTSDQLNLTPFWVSLVKTDAIVDKSFINQCLAKPRKLLTSITDVGLGQLSTASTLLGSTCSLCSDKTCPKKLTLFSQNSHLENIAFNLCSLRVYSTILKYCANSSKLLEYTSISSTNTTINYPHTPKNLIHRIHKRCKCISESCAKHCFGYITFSHSQLVMSRA